jgi:ADP-ribosylglycohydrolase
MALALADSLIEAGWDLSHQLECYLAWRDEGQYSVNGSCFDIGMTCSASLRKYRQTGDARNAASADERSSGNGSIMRLAPVPIRFAYLFPTHIAKLANFAEESSLTTHASAQCLSASRYMAIVLAGLAHGEPREAVLAADWEPLAQLRTLQALHPAVEEIASGTFRRKQPPEIRGSGYVIHSLEAALWAFHDAPDFGTAVLKAVNLGDDADTTGAVCGQFAGAFWGESGIPDRWLSGLARSDMLEDALRGLLGGPRRTPSAKSNSTPAPWDVDGSDAEAEDFLDPTELDDDENDTNGPAQRTLF